MWKMVTTVGDVKLLVWQVVTSAGGVKLALFAMRTHIKNEEVQEHALAFLRGVAAAGVASHQERGACMSRLHARALYPERSCGYDKLCIHPTLEVVLLPSMKAKGPLHLCNSPLKPTRPSKLATLLPNMEGHGTSSRCFT